MQSKRLLSLKLLLVTVAAAVTAYFILVALNKHEFGLTDNGFTFVMDNKANPKPILITNNVDFINKNYPSHLISPTWMPNIRDQALILDWLKIEKVARLVVIAVLWLTSSIFILISHFRNRKKP